MSRLSDLIFSIRGLRDPRIVGWVARTRDIAALATRLRGAGLRYTDPKAGSRARPDGRTLRWKKMDPVEDRHAVLPSFIEWSADSPHPSQDAPAGCRLSKFEIAAPDPPELQRIFRLFELEPRMVRGAQEQVRAQISSAGRLLRLTSL